MLPFLILTIAATVHSRCPIGAIQGAEPSDCYTYNRQQATWSDADAACRRQGGQLPSVVDSDAMLVLQNLPRLGACSYLDYYWLDASYDGRQWKWMDGTTWDYTNWGFWEPKNGTNLYAAMNGFNALWSSYNSTQTNFYICKMPPKSHDTHCPQGTAQGLNAIDCYFYDGGQFSWMNAAAYCQDHGGNLATLTSSFQNSAFKQLPNLVCTDFIAVKNTYWLGGIYSERGMNGDSDYPNQWVWNDGPRRMSYKNWAKGQPNNAAHQCLLYDPDTGNWQSDNCDKQQFYACKLPPIELQTQPKSTPQPPVGQRCPAGFTFISEAKKCLYFEWNKFQWNDALMSCYNLGGTLASFHSKESSEAIWNWVSETMYENKENGRIVYNNWIQIGLSDPNHNGQWQWLDGTPLDWKNWDVGHPCCGFCACAWFQQGFPFNGIWHGLSCDTDPNPHPSICEAHPH